MAAVSAAFPATTAADDRADAQVISAQSDSAALVPAEDANLSLWQNNWRFGLNGLPSGTPAAPTTEATSSVRERLNRLRPGALTNQPPTVAPTITGEDPETGVITGNLNASDPEGAKLTYTVTDQPDHGTVTVDSTGAFVYTPDASTAADGGTDSFTVNVSDSPARSGPLARFKPLGKSTNATVTLTVQPTDHNEAPEVNGPATVGQPDAATGAVVITPNVTDPDGDPITYTSTADGTFTQNTNGTVTYTPTDNERHAAAATPGADSTSIRITASDGNGGTTAFDTVVPVAPKNAAPIGATASGDADDNGTLTGQITGADSDGDTIVYSGATTSAKGGTVTVNSDGSFTYTPTAQARYAAGDHDADVAQKTDTFAVTMDDGHGGTTTQDVTVDVAPSDTLTIQGPAGDGYNTGVTGSRTLITSRQYDPETNSYTTGLTVVDPSTGESTSQTIPGDGWSYTNEDGSKAFTTTSSYDSVTNQYTSHVAVTDLETGTITVSDELPGYGGTQLTADETRAVTTTQTYDYDTAAYTTYVSVLDLQTGTTTTSEAIDGQGNTVLTGDGTSAVTTTTADQTTYVTVTDLATGQSTTGDPLPGQGNTQLTTDGSKAITTTTAYDASGRATTYLTITDVVSGEHSTSDPIVGSPSFSTVTEDGTKVATVTQDYDSLTGSAPMYLTVMDTATGASTTTTMPGQYGGPAFSTEDGSVVYAQSYDYDPATEKVTTYTTIANVQTGDITTTSQDGFAQSQYMGNSKVFTTVGQLTGGPTTIVVTDLSTGQSTSTEIPGQSVGEMTVAPDGKSVVTQSYDLEPGNWYPTASYVSLTNLDTGVTTVIETPGTYQTGTTFSPDGSTLVTNSTDYDETTGEYVSYVTATDIATGKSVSSEGFSNASSYNNSTSFLDDGTVVTSTSGSTPGYGQQVTYTALLNPSTSTTSTTVTPGQGRVVVTDDQTKIVTTTRDYDGSTGEQSTYVTVTDVASGETFTTGSAGYGDLIFNDDQSAAVLTVNSGSYNSSFTSTIATIDLETGETQSVSVPGYATTRVDGNRAITTSQDRDPMTGETTTRVVVSDLESGDNVVSDAIPGYINDGPVLTADGSTVVTTTHVGDQYAGSTYVTITDAHTGESTTSAPLTGFGFTQLANDDKSAVTTSQTYDSASGVSTTYVTVTDLTTGTQTTTVADGHGYTSISPTGDTAVTMITPSKPGPTTIIFTDTATGASTTAMVPTTRYGGSTARYGNDGKAVIVTTSDSDYYYGSGAMYLTYANVESGESTTTELPGVYGWTDVTADGSTAITETRNAWDQPAMTYYTVTNMSTGEQKTTTLSGSLVGQPEYSSDGKTMTVTTRDDDGTIHLTRIDLTDTSPSPSATGSV